MRWDDESIDLETLNNACKAGIFGNSFNGRGWGYMKFTLQGTVLNNKMTTNDFNNIRKWFDENCPDGW